MFFKIAGLVLLGLLAPGPRAGVLDDLPPNTWYEFPLTKLPGPPAAVYFGIVAGSFPAIMDALQKIGYEGYVTVHQAFEGLGGPRQAARESARYLRSLLSA